MPSPSPARGRHPIQVVARRTGLSPEVLRIWEKRYAVVTPTRTATGRRVYSDEDIERLLLLRRVTLGGRRIGDVATLPMPALEALLQEDAQAVRKAPPTTATPEDAVLARPFLEDALGSVETLESEGLASALGRALLALGAPRFLERVVAPLFQEIGARWEAGRLAPYQEHFASGMVRRTLIDIVEEAAAPSRAPILVVATPQGDRHELGALLVAAVAAGEGWRVVNLGPDLPAADIARAAIRSGAAAVAVSAVLVPRGDALAAEIRSLRAALPSNIPLLLGGQAAPRLEPVAGELGILIPDCLATLRATLGDLRSGSAPSV